MTLTRAREIMRDANGFCNKICNRKFKYINTYMIIRIVDDCEIILYSDKTEKSVVVYDREDDGGYTGAHFLKNTYGWRLA